MRFIRELNVVKTSDVGNVETLIFRHQPPR